MRVTILGTGAFGVALARILDKNENDVMMWTKFKEECDVLTLTRENAAVLKGIKLPKSVNITTNLEEAVKDAELIMMAVPMKVVRSVCKDLKEYLKNDQVVCTVAKGIESKTNMFMTDVVTEETGHEKVCVLSGPSFAIDVAKFEPVAFTVAGESTTACKLVAVCFENERTKIEITHDAFGVQIGGALKNVYAVATGILDGMGYNESTRAAFITTALKEMVIFSRAFDSYRDTIYTYSGVGDLLLTCSSPKSRNYRLGKLIGQGMSLEDAKEAVGTTLEGIDTLSGMYSIIQKNNMRLPILEAMYKIIKKGEDKEILLNSMIK